MKVSTSVTVHFYRASVMHADVWRRRLDVTTNWAVVTGVGIVTFAFSQPEHPAISLLVGIPFLCVFLFMESQRYQMYHLWRHRVRLLNRYMVAPSFTLNEGSDVPPEMRRQLAAMASELGTNTPLVNLWQAMGYRIRRGYGLLFAAIVVMWFIKISVHPTRATTMAQVIEHARVGPVSGWGVVASVLMFSGGVIALAVSSPTERMEGWINRPSPLSQLLGKDERAREILACSSFDVQEPSDAP